VHQIKHQRPRPHEGHHAEREPGGEERRLVTFIATITVAMLRAKKVVATLAYPARQPLAKVTLRRAVVVQINGLHRSFHRALQISPALALAGHGFAREDRAGADVTVTFAVLGTNGQAAANALADGFAVAVVADHWRSLSNAGRFCECVSSDVRC